MHDATDRAPGIRRRARRVVLLVLALAGAGCGPSKPAMLDPIAVSEAIERYSSIGPEHEGLLMRLGNWEVSATTLTGPDARPIVHMGSASVLPQWDGRYVIEELHVALEETWHAKCITAFDRFRNEFVSVWIDSNSTGMSIAHGTGDARAQEIIYRGEQPNFLIGDYAPVEIVELQASPDRRVTTYYVVTPDGRKYKGLELRYRRRAS